MTFTPPPAMRCVRQETSAGPRRPSCPSHAGRGTGWRTKPNRSGSRAQSAHRCRHTSGPWRRCEGPIARPARSRRAGSRLAIRRCERQAPHEYRGPVALPWCDRPISPAQRGRSRGIWRTEFWLRLQHLWAIYWTDVLPRRKERLIRLKFTPTLYLRLPLCRGGCSQSPASKHIGLSYLSQLSDHSGDALGRVYAPSNGIMKSGLRCHFGPNPPDACSRLT